MAYGMKRWTPAMVNEADDPYFAFCEYTKQVLGVPHPTNADKVILRRKCKAFFKEYPHTDWFTMCRIVNWMVRNKRRVPKMYMVVDHYRYAWAKGALPELDPRYAEDAEADAMIAQALAVESDERWRRRLLLAQDPIQKREVYASWREEAMAS